MDVTRQIDQHIEVFHQLKKSTALIEEVGRILVQQIRQGGKIIWMGNGGSAADCQHLSAELIGRFKQDRSPIASLSLSSNLSVITALGNDYGFESVFARQVKAICTERDVLIGLSTSGESPNILAAFAEARVMGVCTVALTGSRKLPSPLVVDYRIQAPSDETARIQEAHLFIGHLWCGWIEEKMVEYARD